MTATVTTSSDTAPDSLPLRDKAGVRVDPPAMRQSSPTRRVAFVLPGLHRVCRGAEVAFESVAQCIAAKPGYEVTLFGSGQVIDGRTYAFRHVGCVGREKLMWIPELRRLRGHGGYEEMTFVPGLLRAYRPADFDLTVACTYPYMNWLLRARKYQGRRPAHIYVTQNGDWPAFAPSGDVRRFDCDGLVCTNPEYFARCRDRWNARLIPNGVDPNRFSPGEANRRSLGLPEGVPLVIMVSALDASKRVLEGIRAVAGLKDFHLRVAGTGKLAGEADRLGAALMADRFKRITLPREVMPDFYRAADVFLHMSQVEPSANAYIEALATGLPIVTHDRDVTRWTFGSHAMLVDTSDFDAVGTALRTALAMKLPHHVEARREVVMRRFAWTSIADQYCDLFEQVLTGIRR